MRVGALSVVTFLLSGQLSFAQPTSQPAQAPTVQPSDIHPADLSPATRPSFPSMGQLLQSSSGSGGAPEPLQPTVYPLIPNYDGDWVVPASGPANLLRDGAYIVRRPGTFARSANGQTWEFTPDPVVMSSTQPSEVMAAAPTTGPTTDVTPTVLTVLPSRELDVMQQELARNPQAPARFVVTGMITLYKMQNFLLVDTIWPGDAVSSQRGAGGVMLASDTTKPSTRPGIPATMPASDVLNQMLQSPAGSTGDTGATIPANPLARPIRPANTPPPVDVTTGAAAIAPGAQQMTVLREGTFLVDRTGRLTRSSDGQSWEFSFDSDARSMKDPPVVILPNLKLMSMEQAVKGSNRDLRFRITGMVTEYAGRNYVLLEKVVVVPDSTQQF
jgi:hypothetical protein